MIGYGPCETCGATAAKFLIPVWENPEGYLDNPPDYLGCLECNTMNEYSGGRHRGK